VKELQGLALGTATTDKVRSSLNAIKDDLAKIADAQDQLSEAERQQVQKGKRGLQVEGDGTGRGPW
jgi:hypothetical protein